MDFRFRLGEKGLYRLVNAALLVCIGLVAVGRYFGIAAPGMLHFLGGIVIVSEITLFQYLSVRGRIVGVLGVLGCLSATAVVVGFDNSIRFLNAYVRWLFAMPVWQEKWLTGYEMIQLLFLAVICYLLQMLMEKDFRIRLTGALLLFAGLMYCLFSEKELSHISVAVCVCYLVMIGVEWIQRGWSKVKSRSFHAYMLWIMPFLAIYLLLLLGMPALQKPYDWKLFKDIYQQLQESVRTISQNVLSGGREEYDLSLSGFSEGGSIGGGFFKEEREIMTLQASKSLKTNVYLIGKVYDTFDGKQWLQLSEDTSGERYLDTVETLYAVQRYDKENQQDYVARTDLQIRYKYFSSGYLFAPLKTWCLEKENRALPFDSLGGSLLFQENKGYGTEYEASFYQLNMKQEVFYDFLEAEPEPDEELLKSILSGLNSCTSAELAVEDLEKHRELVYDTYREDMILSEELKEYLEQLMQGAESDVEKLRRIEEELSSFTYTSNPGELPETVTDGSTFLDYFLLESRQGYCSHFATAFVLLARAEGFPARYVQGYSVPIQAGEEVVVTSDRAHAWPEVYLDDIGWVPFEPTPGYARMRYTPWAVHKGEATNATDVHGGYGMEMEKTDVLEELPMDVTDAEMSEEDTQMKHWGLVLQILLLLLGIVLAMGGLVLVLEYWIGRYRYRRMDDSQKYMVEIHRNLKILARLGFVRKEGETLEELQNRMNVGLGQEEKFGFIENYEECLYGMRMADCEMLQQVKGEQNRLLQLLKQKKRWTYLYYSIFMNGYRM